MPLVLVKIDTRDPDLGRLRDIARASRQGKIIAFPTETVYGVGAPMSVPGLAVKLSEIKKRSAYKPFSFHLGDLDMLGILGVRRTPALRFLIRLFWPGPVTLLAWSQKQEKIGLRFPRNRLASALITAAGEPFLATSANVSGMPSARTAEEVTQQLGDKIDYLIDGGRCELGEDSTVVDVTAETGPVIVRRGAGSKEVEAAVEKILSGKFPRKRILFVCTGNSCRSPMAAGLLASELKRKGLADEIEIASCGIGARAGLPATSEAVLVMKNSEVDITGHRSRPCTRDDMLNADLVLAMSEEHARFITGLVPEVKDKIKVFHIQDPIGLGMPIYEEVLAGLEAKIREYWNVITG